MKRVLITRSAAQASELAERLRALHIEPIVIPTIEIADPASFGQLDAALARLIDSDTDPDGEPDGEPAFHWLVFTSANAVAAFQRRLCVLKGASFRSPISESASESARGGTLTAEGNLRAGLKIAAIGPATARALEAIGLQPDLVPPQAVAEALAAALLPYARQSDGGVTRFLLIRAEVARDYLPDRLRAAGAEVTVAPAYRTLAPADSVAQIAKLFRTPETWPDAITFTSSSTATNLQVFLEAAGVSLPTGILRISIGPITSETLRELGWPPHSEAAEPTLDCLATTIATSLQG